MARTSNWSGNEQIDFGRGRGDYPLNELAKVPIRPLAEHSANRVAELDDLGRYNHMTASVSNTYTIPEHATTPFPLGSVLAIVQAGTGATAIAAETGNVVLHSLGAADGGRTLFGQWAHAYARKIGENEWILCGEFAA